ncbi:MAG: hypothetical protein ACYC1K_02980 [Minisyncoccota bacterium]
MEPNKSNMNANGEGSIGPVIALIIILAVIVLGGLYFWGQRTSNNTTDIYGNPISTSTPTGTPTSDTSAAIDADLKATDLNSLDTELNAS